MTRDVMRCARLLACALLCSTSPAALAQDPVDVSSLGQAIGSAEGLFAFRAELRRDCGTLLPERKAAINGLAFFWHRRNQVEERALHAFWKSNNNPELIKLKNVVRATTQALLGAFRILPKEQQAAYCDSMFGLVHTGERDIARETPNVSRFLRQYLEANPLPQVEIERLDYVQGCMGQWWNRVGPVGPYDLDDVKPVCECLLETTERNTSEEERELSRQAAKRDESLVQLPHMQRIAPLLQKCATK